LKNPVPQKRRRSDATKSPNGNAVLRRRLGAVFFADVVNYSRLMGQDEIGTHLAARARLHVLEDMSAQYNGEILDTRGDSAFGLFESAVDAVSFGLQVQKRMEQENQASHPDQRMLFRIGINLGEVLIDEAGVSGDSINIAARIEKLAPPGSVCVSGAVYEQVRNKVAVGYEYLGPTALKNIEEPIEVFLLREDIAPATMMAGYRRLPRGLNNKTHVEPSVVILPFEFQGHDGTETWLADGLAEDITTSLSRFHNLFVISRASAFVHRERSVAPGEAARQFGVRYVVSGSLRKAATRIRITIQLVDAIRDRTIWGEHYNRDLDDIFEIQDEITQIVVSAIAGHIEFSEKERTRTLPPAHLRAYECVLQGQQHIFQYRREENRLARMLYEAALEADPNYARAFAAKSRTLNLDWRYDWTEGPAAALDEALTLALRATDLDEEDARGFGELGFVHLYRKEHDAALSAYRRALLLNPNDADLMSDMADALAHSGRSEESIGLIEKAMQLNPFYPDQYLWHLGGAYFNLRRYEEAIRTVQSMQNPTEGRRLLAASYAQLGQVDEARHHAQKVLEAHPNFSVERWGSVQPDRDEADLAHFLEGLRKAGLN
jgi:TolB-like protein/class 3 adenylate cyclase/Flp pilus assembly protein TadD